MYAYCKSVYTGSIPVPASIKINCLDDYFPQKYAENLIHHSYTLRAQFFTWEELISRDAIDQRLSALVVFNTQLSLCYSTRFTHLHTQRTIYENNYLITKIYLFSFHCKSVYTGSIPVPASIKINCLDDYFPQKYAKNLIHHSYTLRAQFFTW